MHANEPGNKRYPWTGPALFTAVLVALVIFFWWFLR